MDEIKFFDVCCRVGIDDTGNGETLETLLAEMRSSGVEKALVQDNTLAHTGAVKSNQTIAGLLRKEECRNLYGVWCLLPEATEELPPPEELFLHMKENKIRALTFCPQDHRWLPCRLSIGNYMKEAAKRRVPVILSTYCGQWKELYDLLAEFPENIFIFSGNYGKWGIDRQIRPLLDAYKNLFFNIGGYWLPTGIRDLVARYGAERLLFGSLFPQYAFASAMLQLKYSGITQEEIALIASGNLERLLEGETL